MATTGAIGAQGAQTLTATGATTGAVSSGISGTLNGSAIAVSANTALALSATKGATAPTGIVTYTNSGNTAVTLSLTGLSAPYSLSASTCLVNPSSTCSVTVTMATSGAIGAQGAQNLVATGGTTGVVNSSINGTLNGSAVAATTNTAAALSAATGAAPATGTITYTNSGNTAVTLSLTGLSVPYSLSASTCLVNPGSTCSVAVSMATSGAVGAQGSQTLTATGATTGAIGSAVSGTLTTGAPATMPPEVSNANAGTIPGTASTQAGKATYSIPISLPPGVAGMVPAVSLSYGGGTANGVAGVGWSLNASSSIGRCGPTIVQDTRVDAVRLASTDRLCLDGKRLVASQADYWAAAAEYRTEIFDGSRILRNGLGFKVFSKDGRIHYYGDTAETTREGQLSGAPVTHTWILRRSEDRLGNAIDFSYAKDATTGEHLLTAIRWGANVTAGQTAFGKVGFTYEARPDADVTFIAGGRADVNSRLASITTSTDTAADGTGGTQVLQYTLSYEQSPTSGRSMVTAIQLCSVNDGCLPATTFAWGKPDPSAPRTFASKGVWSGPVLEDAPENAPYGHSAADMHIVADFDGDGLNDIIMRYPEGGAPITLYRNTGSSFAASTAIAGLASTYFIYETGDFDGDGQTDLVLAEGTYDSSGFLQPTNSLGTTGGLSNFQICFSRLRQGQGFQCAPWADAGQDPNNALHMVYDFNGDGRSDLYLSNDSYDDGTPLKGRMCLANGTGFATCTPLAKPFQLAGGDPVENHRPWVGAGSTDFDGDGRLDSISFSHSYWDPESQKYLYTAGGGMQSKSYSETGAGGSVSFAYGTPLGYRTVGTGAAGDINGDGYSDVALQMDPGLSLNTEWRRCVGTGLLAGAAGLYCESVALADPGYAFLAVGDFDGDGNNEVLTRLANSLTNLSSCTIRTGDSVKCTTGWSFKAFPGGNIGQSRNKEMSIDFSGNGVPDRVYYTAGGGWEILTPTSLAKPGEALDRLVQVVDGLNKAVRFDYALPGDSTVYSPDALDANGQPIAISYPLRRTPRMGALVRGMRVSNGQGGWIETQYKYAGAARDMSGRGYAGFARVDATDVASAITSTTWFSQTWPYIGMASVARQTCSGGISLSMATSTLDKRVVPSSAGQSTTIPYVKQSITDRHELCSAAVVATTTSDSLIDDYGSATFAKQTVVGGGKTFTTTTTTTYQNDPATWLIALPTNVVVSKVRDGATVTRTSGATYDANGLPQTQTVEPDDVTFKVLTTIDRSGNPYGLAKKTTQAWRDPATSTDVSRVPQEVLSFDAKGRFPLQVKNAAGHTEMYQYDPRFGARTQLTNANLVTTNWSVDGFGRALSELPADGTEHRMVLRQCGATCPTWATQVQISLPLKAGALYAAASLTYLDNSGRTLRTQTTGLNGKLIQSDQRHDARGRPTEQDQPRFSDAPAVLASRNTYDDLNRVKTATVFSETGVARTTTTDYNGLSVTVTNPKNQRIVNVNDALGLLAQATDALNGVTTYARDPFGNLSQVTDPLGNVVTISYDRLGHRTDLKDPDLGWVHYDTDPAGRVWRQQSPKQRPAGQATTFQFDLLDRMVLRSETDLTSTWVYDTAATGMGQLAEAYTGTPTLKDYRRVHTYDSLGRPSTTTTTLDVDYTTTTSYDGYGRVSQTSNRRGASGVVKAYDYVYSPQGPLQSILRAGQSLWQASVQDAAQRTTGSIFGNGLTEEQTFNIYSGRLTGAAVGTSRLVEGYTYDELGNVTQRVQTWDGAGFTESFTYDGMNRLATAQVGTAIQTYLYNAIGNMTSKTGVGTGDYVYPASGAGSVQPHAVQSIPGLGSYGYDLNGNLISAPNGAVLSWKSFDMPDTLSRGGVSDQFVYGPEHQRARQNRSDGTALYYAGAMEVEVKAGVTTLKTYWPTGLGVEIDKTGVATELLWTHTDRLGSVIGLTNSAGTFKEKLAYDAWGKRRTTDGTSTPDTLDGQADNKGFTGHEMLDNIDMVHMNGRIYEPNIARFVSADPIIQDPEHSQSYNRYSYVWNNPTNLTDPTGFAACGAEGQPVCPEPAKLKEQQRGVGTVPTCINTCDNKSGAGEPSSNGGTRNQQDSKSNGRENQAAKGGGCGGQEGMCHSGSFRPPSENDVRLAGTLVGTGAILAVGAATGTLPLAMLLVETTNLADGVPGGRGATVVTTEAAAVARGGIGPVLQGEAGVARSIAAAEARGETVLGREITMQTSGGRTKPDILVRDAQGNLKFIESKCGPGACLNTNQKYRFPELQQSGGIPRGKNAAAAGLTPGQPMGPTPVQVDYWPR
jgi:RHS repeat-associated protein